MRRPAGREDTRAPAPDGTAEKRSPAAGSSKHGARDEAMPWSEARTVAERAARSVSRREPVGVPLEAALGLVLAASLTALTDLPSFDTSAMDGWAVAGPGPWDVREEGILAGHAEHAPLGDGEAVRIATGARVPPGATAVLRSEHGHTDDKGRLQAGPRAAGFARAGGPPRSCTVRTSGRGGRSATAGTDCCRSVPRSPRPCSDLPRPQATTI